MDNFAKLIRKLASAKSESDFCNVLKEADRLHLLGKLETYKLDMLFGVAFELNRPLCEKYCEENRL